MSAADDLKRLLCEDGSVDPGLVQVPYRHTIAIDLRPETEYRLLAYTDGDGWRLFVNDHVDAPASTSFADTTEAAADLIAQMLAREAA